MNIVFFGDSLLARMSKSPIAKLESLVENATVYNCAAGGFTTRDGLRRVSLLSKLSPDAVIISLGANDVAPWKTVIPKDEYLQNMKTIFDACGTARKVVLICPDALLNDEEQTTAFNEALHDYTTALEEIMKDESFRVVSANKVLNPLNGAYHVEDGLHINDEGYELIIAAFAEALK